MSLLARAALSMRSVVPWFRPGVSANIRAMSTAVSEDMPILEKGRRFGMLKRFKPTTPGIRHKVLVDRSGLHKGKPVKALTVALRKHGGRNNTGRITVRHRGGGHKRRYRLIDFKRSLMSVPAVVKRLEYDPNRSAWLALLTYQNGALSYILAPQEVEVGDTLISGPKVDVKPGNAMPLKGMPIGTIIHNIELKPGKGGQLCRSAGTSAQLMEKTDAGYALIRLRSKELRYLPLNCMATVGSVSNPNHKHEVWGKAGRSRWKGFRPSVRGVAMNPVDHPHGGGEGKAQGGRPSVTPWGWPTKGGYRTRKPANPLNKFRVKRRPPPKKRKC